MSGYWLRVTEPGHPARVVTVDQVLDIGRAGHDIVLDDPTSSRHHCKIEPDDGGLLVTDLGSANGTLVDGERIGSPRLVGPGGVIVLGETEMVVVQGHATRETSVDSAPVDPSARPSEAMRELSKVAGKGGLGSFRKS